MGTTAVTENCERCNKQLGHTRYYIAYKMVHDVTDREMEVLEGPLCLKCLLDGPK